MITLFRSFMIAAALLISNIVLAQTDVIATIQLTPPYSPYLSTYVDQPNKLLLTLVNVTNQTQQLKLWVKVSGDNGVTISTSAGFNPAQPIVLAPFQTKSISFSSPETRDYFDVNHVDVIGITKSDLIQNQALPEGNYQICVRALDYNPPFTQRSIDACTPLPIFYIDPPLATQPACSTNVTASTPQFMLFAWTPPATAPGQIQYEFTLKVVPNGMNPNDVIKNSAFPAVFSSTQTNNTTLTYTVAQPVLEDGKQYVWRVKANDPSKGVQFKNGGYSEACTFTYAKTVPAADKEKITLVSPANGTEIGWVAPSGSEYGHYELSWKNLTIPGKTFTYHTKLVKINDGQTKDQAISKNMDLNQNDKGEPANPPFKYFAKLDAGKYAWMVVTNNDNPASGYVSDVWEFTVGNKEEVDLKEFEICGFKVNVTSLSNKDIDSYSGLGYIQLWPNAPKADVKFTGLNIRNTAKTNGQKTGWRVTKGFVEGDCKNYDPFVLNPKEIEGDFILTLKGFSIESAITASYDKNKDVYIVEEGDKGEGCKRRAWCELEWKSPFVEYKPNNTPNQWDDINVVNINLGPQNLILSPPPTNAPMAYGLYVPVFGSMMFEKDIEIRPNNPSNCVLTISKGSWFSVTGRDVYARLNGIFSMWNGKKMLLNGKFIDWYDAYTYEAATSLLLKLTPTIPTGMDMWWNKNGSVHSDLGKQQAWAALGDKSPADGINVKGLIYPDFRVDIKLANGNSAYCNFKGLVNKGKGYNILKAGTPGSDAKFSAFKSKLTDAHIKISESKLVGLSVNGDIEIPFINAKAKYVFTADYISVNPGYCDLEYKETVVFQKGADKITCYPTTAYVNYDKVVLGADFNFTNTAGKNVIAEGVHMSGIGIHPNGDVKPTGFLSWVLINQVNGTFNQYPFKIKTANITGDGATKTYKFILGGGLTLEENTLAPKSDFSTTLSFTQPQSPDGLPYYNEQNLTACIGDETVGIDDPVVLSPDDNSLTVKPGQVCAAVSPNGTSQYEGCFSYFTDSDLPFGPTYGSGFMLTVDATFKNPMEKKLSAKIMVGKKDGYRYWFVAADQQGFVEVPTGVLDISIYGFGGRAYYHMNHVGGAGNINSDNYVPDPTTGIGLYGIALIETAGSQGEVLWGKLSTEIQTTADWGLKSITQRGEVWLFSSGKNKTDAKITAVADLTMHFQGEKYLEGYIQVDGSMYDMIELHGTANILFSSGDWHIYAGTKEKPMYVKVIPLGKPMNAYFTVQLAGGQVKLGAGASGEFYGIHASQCKCLVGYWKGCVCSGCYHADVSLSGAIDAYATFPSPQLGGSFSLTGSASVGASICGVDLDPSVSATFTGAFEMPSPFCLAGGIKMHTPWPFPDFDFKARWKDGSFSKTDNCN